MKSAQNEIHKEYYDLFSNPKVTAQERLQKLLCLEEHSLPHFLQDFIWIIFKIFARFIELRNWVKLVLKQLVG